MHDFEVLALREHFLAELTVVVLVENDALNSGLNDHLGAEEARETCRVYRASHCLRSSSLNHCGLLCMETLALVKLKPLRDVRVTPGAASFIAILVLERRPVVAGRDYSEVFHDDCPVSPLHAIRPLRRQLCKLHEVRVP